MALTWLRSQPQLKWLAAGGAPAQQAVERTLADAWAQYFAGLAKPAVLTEKGENSGFRGPGRQHAQLDPINSRIKVPKVGGVRDRNSRRIEGEVINVTPRRSGRGWQMAWGTEGEVAEPERRTFDDRVGIDMNISVHTAPSNGHNEPGPRALGARAARLWREQRKPRRRKKESKRRPKPVHRLAPVHQHMASVRNDHLHKFTTAIAKDLGLVCVEDLKVANMGRSGKGMLDQPGRNVHAKAGLNRSILDQKWS